MTDHARLSPSNERWPNCAGSLREESTYPDIPGKVTIDGAGSHILLEMCLDNNVPAIQYDQQIIGVNHPENPSGWLVGIERVKRVQMCLDYVQHRVNELKTQFPNSVVRVGSETKSNPGALFNRDDWWGSCDITITCQHETSGELYFIEICDYKDGGMYVSAKNKPQLQSYMLGKLAVYSKINISTVGLRMSIVQPKTNPVIRYQCSSRPEDDLTYESIMEIGKKLNRAAIATDDPHAPLTAGKHCTWCKANPKRGGHCKANIENSIRVISNMNDKQPESIVNLPMFEQISHVITDPRSMTSDQLSELLSAKDALLAAFDNCEKEIIERLNQGQEVNGYAMKPGRITKQWNEDEASIVKKLKSRKLKSDDIYPKKLVSPAQVLSSKKLDDSQKKRIEKELISEIPGKLTLKKVARNSEKSSLKQMFADVIDTPAEIKVIEKTNNDEISFF